MSISSINFSGNNVNSANNVTADTKKQTASEKKPVSKTAIGIGFVGLTALAAVGIYIATKGKFGKQVVKQDIPHKAEEVVENIEAKFEKIMQQFNEGPYKNVQKTVGHLKNGKITITLGEGANRTVYIYDQYANPERMINFVNKGYTVNIPTENGAWEISKVKRHDIKTGDVIIEKYGKEQSKTGTKKPVENITVSKEEKKRVIGI